MLWLIRFPIIFRNKRFHVSSPSVCASYSARTRDLLNRRIYQPKNKYNRIFRAINSVAPSSPENWLFHSNKFHTFHLPCKLSAILMLTTWRNKSFPRISFPFARSGGIRKWPTLYATPRAKHSGAKKNTMTYHVDIKRLINFSKLLARGKWNSRKVS